MQEYFKQEYLIEAMKQRKKVLIQYFVMLTIYLIVSGGILLYYTALPYGSKIISTVKVIQFILCAIFVIISFIFLEIRFSRVNNYFNVCKNMTIGLKETSIVNFFEYNENLTQKDGVDMKSLVFLEWNKFKKDYYERNVYVFYEKEFPVLKENAQVKIVTQGNVLYSYEIIEE